MSDCFKINFQALCFCVKCLHILFSDRFLNKLPRRYRAGSERTRAGTVRTAHSSSSKADGSSRRSRLSFGQVEDLERSGRHSNENSISQRGGAQETSFSFNASSGNNISERRAIAEEKAAKTAAGVKGIKGAGVRFG